jgi:cytidine deaminase
MIIRATRTLSNGTAAAGRYTVSSFRAAIDRPPATPFVIRGLSMSASETVPTDDALLADARAAAAHAHSPYSGWRVGAAAVFAETGPTVFRGANVENGSYGLTICAERSAICAGVVAGGRRLERIALTCRDSTGQLIEKIAPCGACLQVIAEFATPDTRIVIDGRAAFRLADFLPLPFGADTLKAHGDVTEPRRGS